MRLMRQGNPSGKSRRCSAGADRRSRASPAETPARGSTAPQPRSGATSRGGRHEAYRRPRLLDDEGRRSLELGRGWPLVSTIYRAIAHRDPNTPELVRTVRGLAGRLRHRGKRRHHAGVRRGGAARSREATPISERPAVADSRSRPGDWEVDTMAARGDGARLVTLVDRGREFAGHAEVAAVGDALNRRTR